MREFYLVSETGATYFFDDKSKALVSGISDLGFSKDNTYLGFDGRYVLLESKDPQGSLSFKVVFLNGYRGYSDFIAFIRKSNELRFFYKLGDDSKFCYVSLKSVTKTELESNAIQSAVTFDKLSLWLVRESHSIRVDQDHGGKVFPHPYPFVYASSYKGTITISNDSESPSPIDIQISGAVKNPSLEVIRDGEVISKLRLLVESTNAVIEVSSTPSNQLMTMREDGKTTNIYALQDFSCDNFLFIGKGEYQLRFCPGVSSNTTCRVTVTKGYAGQ